MTAEKLAAFRQSFMENLPKPVGYVNDFEEVFTAEQERVLANIIADFERKTTIQIAIATFDSVMVSKDSLDNLTLHIGNAWGVGQKGKDNGIVIGICRGHRRIRIQTSFGIEKILSDAATKQVIDEAFIPYFKKEEYFEGTVNGLKQIIAKLEAK